LHFKKKAEKLFRELCPLDPFLPKPPELEDIIFNEEEEPNKNAKTDGTNDQDQVPSKESS
jgi:hypothetical protein